MVNNSCISWSFKLGIIVIACCIHPFAIKAESHFEYLKSIKKFDVHAHVRADEVFIREVLEKDNWKYITVCVASGGAESTLSQRKISRQLYEKYPRFYAWVTTFDVEGMFEPGWTERVLKDLKTDFANGAIGVKVWKNIGMEIQKPNGEYIQLDDPLFKPIWNLITQENKTLLAHMGEPLHAWMPTYITEDGIPRNYWATHPEYSFYDKPDKPSYSDIISAADTVVRENPNMRYVGAHLASLEFDVAELALRMDKYPNFAVEIGGRMRYLMWQARGKVRAFFIKYQDRIMYGTDLGASAGMTDAQRVERKLRIEQRNDHFSRHLATDDEFPFGDLLSGEVPVPEPTYSVTGLALPETVLKKIMYDNVLKWFPGAEVSY